MVFLRRWAWPGGIFLLALALRLHGIAGKPFWLDEITTLGRSQLPFLGVIADSLSFHHMPSYFLLTSWVVQFGNGELALRLPSALFGALACALVFAVARRLGGLRAGLAAGLLMALSPAQVQYGQEARSYALVICLIMVGLWGQVALARDLRRATLPLHDPLAERAGWAAYALGTCAAVGVLSVALFWWFASNVAAAGLWLRAGSGRRAFLRRWAWSQAVIAGLNVPWFIAMAVLVNGHMGSGLDWVPPVTVHHLWSTFSTVYLLRISSLISFHIFPQPLPWVGLAVVLLAVLGGLALRRRRETLLVLACGVLVLPVCLLLISLHKPMLMPRYMLWGAAPFYVLAGLGVGRLRRSWQLPSLAVIAAVGLLNLLPYYEADTKPRWDLAAAELGTQMVEGDVLLVNDLAAVTIMNLYLGRASQAIYPAQWTIDMQQALATLAGGGRVWAIHGKLGQADPEDREAFLARISPLGMPAVWKPLGHDVVLLRFDPPAPPPAGPCTASPCEKRDGFSAGRPPRRDA